MSNLDSATSGWEQMSSAPESVGILWTRPHICVGLTMGKEGKDEMRRV